MSEAGHGRSNSVFWAAMFFSALLHILGLIYIKLPAIVHTIQGKTALTVILAPPKRAFQKASPPALPLINDLIKHRAIKEPTPKEQPEPETVEIEALTHEYISEPMPEQDASETLQAMPADPVISTERVIQASKVRVVLQVNERGEVQQIIWNALPVVSNDVLQRMESQLRMKAYLSTGKPYTVSEIVEIPRE
jgi:hypothetical protein